MAGDPASSSKPENDFGYTPKDKKGHPILESTTPPGGSKVDYVITRSEDRTGKLNDSIIVRGTEEALSEAVDHRTGKKISKIEKATNIACIEIKSNRFSGYLVCAMGKNRKIDNQLMNLAKQRLFTFLKNNGEKVKEDDSLALKLQEVDFTDWALEQAEFLRRSIHDGNEIAMAFFPSAQNDIKLEDSASEKMLQLDLKDLKEDTALEFDLYMFMPQNNKYLLYTPKGQPFYGGQKDRLSTKGVTHMHLRKDSAHSVKKYHAQNFLNDKIASYKSAKTKI
jgi:hypothetical protein